MSMYACERALHACMFLERLPEIEYVDKNGKEKKKIRTKVPPLNSVTWH